MSDQFTALLQQMLSTDKNVRQPAEDQYAAVRKNPATVPMVATTLNQYATMIGGDESLRSLAAVLLRRLFFDADVSVLTEEHLGAIKVGVLAAIDKETISHLRSKLADVAVELAFVTLGEGQWPEFSTAIYTWATSPDPGHREIAFKMFGSLNKIFVEHYRNNMGEMLRLFSTALSDTNHKVKVAGMSACAATLANINEKATLKQFEALLSPMVDTISHCIQSGNETDASKALESFVIIAEKRPIFFKPCLGAIADGMLGIVQQPDLQDETRHLAMEFLLTLAESIPVHIRKSPELVQKIVSTAMALVVEIDDDDLVEWNKGVEDDAVTHTEVGQEALDRIALALGGKATVPAAFAIIPSYMTHADWRFRYASVITISVIAEGCIEQFTLQLEEITKQVLSLAQDAHPRVRWAVCQCSGQLSADFAPIFQSSYAQSVIPALMMLMEDTQNPRVQSHAASAVINFAEDALPEYLTPFLPQLIPRLHDLLRSPTMMIQESAITAIASTADCVGENFAQFYPMVVPTIKHVLSSATTKEYSNLRGKAFECISLIGCAVPREIFLADAKEILDHLAHTQSQALDPDDPQTSYILQAWTRMCKSLKADFIPYLQITLPPLFEAVKKQPDIRIAPAEEDNDLEGYDTIVEDGVRMGIKTSELHEKATACHMLGSYVGDLLDGFYPYVPETLNVLVDLLDFPLEEEVRIAAATTMPDLLKSCTLAIKNQGVDANHLPGMIQQIFPAFLKAIDSEDDTDVLLSMMQAFNECLNAIRGLLPAPLVVDTLGVLNGIIQSVQKRDQERAAQASNTEDVDAEELRNLQETSKHDAKAVLGVGEVIGALLKFQTDVFVPIFVGTIPQFEALVSPDRPLHERQMALCVFCDLLEHVGDRAAAVLPGVMQVMMQHCMDPLPEIRQAAVYGVGAAAEFQAATFSPAASQAAAVLVQIVGDPMARNNIESERAADNAASALMKICRYHAHAVDVPRLLPVWLRYLPMKGDQLEARANNTMLCKFILEGNQIVCAPETLPGVIGILVDAIHTTTADKEVEESFVQVLRGFPADQLTALYQSFSPARQQKLTALNAKYN